MNVTQLNKLDYCVWCSRPFQPGDEIDRASSAEIERLASHMYEIWRWHEGQAYPPGPLCAWDLASLHTQNTWRILANAALSGELDTGE